MSEQLDIFQQPDLCGMVHRRGLSTERQSAAAIVPHRNAIQAAVLERFKRFGPMTAEQCERLSDFIDYAPSTVRKRISELQIAGDLVADGTTKNSRGRPMTVWRAN
ncbi:MAG: hypothetical protein V4457_06045 [Pseudomonadota bacterium]